MEAELIYPAITLALHHSHGILQRIVRSPDTIRILAEITHPSVRHHLNNDARGDLAGYETERIPESDTQEPNPQQ